MSWMTVYTYGIQYGGLPYFLAAHTGQVLVIAIVIAFFFLFQPDECMFLGIPGQIELTPLVLSWCKSILKCQRPKIFFRLYKILIKPCFTATGPFHTLHRVASAT
ncbi:hypothetical protein GOODEAATRI_001184 [Goodea atripinnis]|uniref:Uncharacterized protein n=1 Tax=Goodea atripinnis TaxID=208336 RepID=A0ABV0PK61_9TELE